MQRRQVGELEKGSSRSLVTWPIPNFMSLSKGIGSYYCSPNFYFLNFRWALKIYPNDRSKGCIGIYLDRRSKGPPQAVNCVFGIRKADGRVEDLFQLSRENAFSEEAPSRGTSRFLHRTQLLLRKSELLPSEILTIVCTLWTNVEDERLTSSGEQTKDLTDGVAKEEVYARLNSKGGAILRKHFQDLLLNGNDHDVTLKVKDQEFKAHKSILQVRSPVFAAMLAYSMSESGEVYIEDCDPNAFSAFLKYVYVGKVENISAATAAGLYYMAEKYDLPDLKEACVEFLKSGLTPNVVCDVLPLAMNRGEDELLKCAMEFFSNRMQETFMTAEWQCFMTNNPLLANELNIKALNYCSENGRPLKKRKRLNPIKSTLKRT